MMKIQTVLQNLRGPVFAADFGRLFGCGPVWDFLIPVRHLTWAYFEYLNVFFTPFSSHISSLLSRTLQRELRALYEGDFKGASSTLLPHTKLPLNQHQITLHTSLFIIFFPHPQLGLEDFWRKFKMALIRLNPTLPLR